jgi:hypothetical protein
VTAPLIVSALFGPEDFAWLDGLRRQHFPPERNQLSAHLTLFHHLPPSIASELDHRLAEEAKAPPPPARLVGPMKLGGGVALRVESAALEAVRDGLAEAFADLLVPQDRQRWRPHVTIQNKVPAAAAAALYAEMMEWWRDRPLAIAGLAGWWYRGGPWELAFSHKFRGTPGAKPARGPAAQSSWPMPVQLRSNAARPASR